MRTALALRAVLLAVLVTALAAATPGVAPSEAVAEGGWFEFLHVEANEGGSSGGHAAIRFGGEVFHFQHHPGGFVRLQRDDVRAFLHRYARLENRAVHVQRVTVRRETFDRLRGRFGARLLEDERRFAAVAALDAEHALLAARAAGATPHVPVRGAGFFALPLPAPAATPPRGRDHAAAGDARDDTGSLAERAAARLAADLALHVLATAPPLRASAVRDEPLDELALAPDERVALARHADLLAARAAALPASPRADFGSVLLLTLARRATVARSLAVGRLVVLDAYPPDAPSFSPEELRAHAAQLPELLAEARVELDRARRALARAPVPRELDLTALEAAVNRYLELRGALAERRALRVARGALLPAGELSLALPPDLAAAVDATPQTAARAAQRAAAYRDALRAERGYELLRRNCVSEIFHEIAAALAEPDSREAAPRRANVHDDRHEDRPLDCRGSARALGGCVDPGERFRSIPFVAASAVADAYPVATTRTVPSYRSSRLAEMYDDENDLLVFLREGNVLTSSLYRPRDDDSVFVFFTEDVPLARPLLGVVNLAVGLGSSAAGLLALPADGGTLLRRGVRGALFSVPELAFVTIRKGSFAYAPRAPLDDIGDDASPPAQTTGAAPAR